MRLYGHDGMTGVYTTATILRIMQSECTLLLWYIVGWRVVTILPHVVLLLRWEHTIQHCDVLYNFCLVFKF